MSFLNAAEGLLSVVADEDSQGNADMAGIESAAARVDLAAEGSQQARPRAMQVDLHDPIYQAMMTAAKAPTPPLAAVPPRAAPSPVHPVPVAPVYSNPAASMPVAAGNGSPAPKVGLYFPPSLQLSDRNQAGLWGAASAWHGQDCSR